MDTKGSDNKPPQTPPTDSQSSNQPQNSSRNDESIKIAEELGQIKARAAQYEDYIKQVVPIIQSINNDPELSAKVLERVNQSQGKPSQTPAPPADNKGKDDDKKVETPQRPDPTAIETRNAMVVDVVSNFIKERGITALDEKESQRIQGLLATELGDILDPMGNKTLPQIFQEVSLTRLPKFLDKAWALVERQLSKKQDPVIPQLNKAMAPGTWGSLASSGGSGDQDESMIVLNDSERKTAKNMGISEEKYLENKKAILKRQTAESYY